MDNIDGTIKVSLYHVTAKSRSTIALEIHALAVCQPSTTPIAECIVLVIQPLEVDAFPSPWHRTSSIT